MEQNLIYRKYHNIFKVVTALIMITLCLTTVKMWNYYGVGIAGVLLLLFNVAVTERRFDHINWKNIKAIRIATNFVLMSFLLYYTKMSVSFVFIPFYFYMITITTSYFGIRYGLVIVVVSMGITVLINLTNGFYYILHQIFLYFWAIIIGYFAYNESKRNFSMAQKLKELNALDKICRIIDDFPETQEILDNITKVVAETMDSSASIIMFYDDIKDRLLGKAIFGLSKNMLEREAEEHGIERRVIDLKENFFVLESKGIDHHQRLNDFGKFSQGVAVPLLFRNKIIGTLSVYWDMEKIISESEKELLYLLSSKIGIVLENDKLYKQVKNNSITDGLTGLYNHKQFYERLRFEIDQVIEGDSKLFLLMVDIDRFKSFNDQFGHIVGDKVLVEMAKTIRNSIRETDIAARYGGEEFAIILCSASQETAAVVADRIRFNVKKISESIEETKGKDIEITVSIGIACYPNCSNDLTNLVDIADYRMYKGKEMGGDKVIA